MRRPSYKQVKEFLDYDPETGIFRWKKKTGHKTVPGRIAGGKKIHGYIAIGFLGERFYAHQLAWLWMTEKWPKEIDHKNCDRADNRWENLRIATRFHNNGNRKLGFKHKNFNLPKGVIKRQNKGGSISYFGRIVIRGKMIWLGARSTPEVAHMDYIAAAKKYFGEYARAE